MSEEEALPYFFIVNSQVPRPSPPSYWYSTRGGV
jgi:hypothetical protein